MSTIEKIKEVKKTTPSSDECRNLILHNDEVNTFDHVIDCLIDVCSHSIEQAEQCAIITHYKGKCDILNGSYSELKPIREILQIKDLSVTID